MSEMSRLYTAIEELKKATQLDIEALADAAAKGRLVILPCAVGDTVYCLERDNAPCVHDPNACPNSYGEYHSFDEMMKCPYVCPEDVYSIREHMVSGFEFCGTPLKLEDAGEWGYEGLERFRCEGGIFLTREEAEAALKLYGREGENA